MYDPYRDPRMGNNFFPQPQGNVYFISGGYEAAQLPTGSQGVTVGLDVQENMAYVKMMQRGIPSTAIYRLVPYSNEPPAAPQNNTTSAPAQNNAEDAITKLLNRLDSLESKINAISEQPKTNNNGSKLNNELL